ncbi:hypothetical protein [Marinoscillum sp.]|uniref:hypothetical protein n=1 Tax=Marinoscillum sp. TaxID=2024838 RepID=UPI003BA9CAA4
MRTLPTRLICLIALLPIASCSDNRTSESTFQLDGESQLYLINATQDSLDIRIRDIAIWPEKSHYLVYTLAPGEHKLEERKTQGRNDYYLFVDAQNFNLYTTPGNRDTITISPKPEGKVSLTYRGDMQSVHEFLEGKSDYFNSHMSDRDGRSEFMITGGNSLTDIFDFNDSLTIVNQDYIESHRVLLPEWYVGFEQKRLDYLNAWYKMNAVLYRTKTLKIDEVPAEEVLRAPYQKLDVEALDMLGNRDYMNFLSQYITYQIDLIPQGESQAPRGSRKEEIARRLRVIDQHFNGELKEAYLTYELSQYIDRGLLYDSAWLDQVKTQRFRSFLGNVKSYYTDHH